MEPPEPICIYKFLFYIYIYIYIYIYMKSNEISIKFALGYKEEKYV